MKFFLSSALLFAFLLTACTEKSEPTSPPVDDRTSFELNYLQYSGNSYFLDTVYADTSSGLNLFNLFYGSQLASLNYRVKDIEVYKSIHQVSQVENSITAQAYINLPPRTAPAMYPDELRQSGNATPGEHEIGRFELLNLGSDYIIQWSVGFITFLTPIDDADIIAVAYRIENGSTSDSDDLFYGEFISELVNNSKTTGVLKLVKPAYLKTQYKKAWKLKMKNMYRILPYYGRITDLDLDIYLKKSDGTETNSINNVRLLELFGFDNFNADGTPGHDGKFDNRAGMNYITQTSEIIFPVIQPFGQNIPYQLKDYKYQAIYDTLQNYLSLPGNSFVIKGKYKPI